MAKSLPDHLKEVEVLQNAYGAGVVAKLLGITDRAIEKWFQSPDISPRQATLRTISELYQKHIEGVDVAKNALSDDYRDKYVELLEKQVATLTDQVNLATGELRHIAVMNFAM